MCRTMSSILEGRKDAVACPFEKTGLWVRSGHLSTATVRCTWWPLLSMCACSPKCLTCARGQRPRRWHSLLAHCIPPPGPRLLLLNRLTPCVVVLPRMVNTGFSSNTRIMLRKVVLLAALASVVRTSFQSSRDVPPVRGSMTACIIN